MGDSGPTEEGDGVGAGVGAPLLPTIAGHRGAQGGLRCAGVRQRQACARSAGFDQSAIRGFVAGYDA